MKGACERVTADNVVGWLSYSALATEEIGNLSSHYPLSHGSSLRP